jgi:hypothetical protein
MAKGGKVVFGTVAALGVLGAIAYFVRQGKLLRQICVSHTDIGWESTVYEVGTAVYNGETPSNLEVPFHLTLVNNSNIDVIIKDVDMSITWLSQDTALLGSDKLIGNVKSTREDKLVKNSTTTITMNVDLSPITNLTTGQLLLLTGDIASNGIRVIVQGNVKLKASIFETINYPYYLNMNTADALDSENTIEESGECK